MCFGHQIDYPAIFDDDEWNVFLKCHVEENGEWWVVGMHNPFEHTLRSPPGPGSDACLYFGEEYCMRDYLPTNQDKTC